MGVHQGHQGFGGDQGRQGLGTDYHTDLAQALGVGAG